MTSLEKGNSLETAVRAIELAILRRVPGYNEKTFRIEGKKIIRASRVRHEIDVWVDVEVNDGHTETFIFECRNRKSKASKNDIIVFAEKIKVTHAQTGVFVAKDFTRDALAQAELEPRIELLRVRELGSDEVPMRVQAFHGLWTEVSEQQCCIVHGHALGTTTTVDLASAAFIVDGEVRDLGAYLREWIAEEVNKGREQVVQSAYAITVEQNAVRGLIVKEGIYPVVFEASRVFSGSEVKMNDERVEQMTVSGKANVHVVPGVIVSKFDVATRGRVIRCLVEFSSGVSVTMDEWTTRLDGYVMSHQG